VNYSETVNCVLRRRTHTPITEGPPVSSHLRRTGWSDFVAYHATHPAILGEIEYRVGVSVPTRTFDPEFSSICNGSTRCSARRLASASLSTGVARCRSILPSSTRSEGARLTEISVLNRETESRRSDVMGRDHNTADVVSWNRSDAPAVTPGTGSSDLVSIGRTVWRDPVSAPGNYRVYADADIGTDATESD
jgi:hypothetical protein